LRFQKVTNLNDENQKQKTKIHKVF
jgi:hypothetical protein